MATLAEQAFSAVQVAFNNLGSALPANVIDSFRDSVQGISTQINNLQAAAQTSDAAKAAVTQFLDTSKAGLQDVRAGLGSLSPQEQANVNEFLNKFEQYIDAERDETLNGPRPVVGAQNAKPWYEQPWFIAVATLLGLLVLSLIATAIYYGVKGAKQNKQAVEQVREQVPLGRSDVRGTSLQGFDEDLY